MIKLIRNLLVALLAGMAGCSSETSSPSPPADLHGDSTINPIILELMKQHEIEAQIDDGWVVVADRPSICGAVVTKTRPTPDVISIQIDIYFKIAPDRILVESFGGLGTTLEEAVADGINNFAVNSLHVLLSAFYEKNDRQAVIEQWTINGIPRRVTIGHIGMRGNVPDSGEGSPEWFLDLEKNIKKSSLQAGTHWVRCYYAQMENQSVSLEILRDNQHWKAIQTEMEKTNWPKADDFFSVRVFLVIQDHDK
ncbi:DUF6348 family protein [Gimesia sp.]|uniref:DUF6348 family protein n=1 Tax=Gimesia sp. TaxID=2024833 RepID=UPI003A8DBC8F